MTDTVLHVARRPIPSLALGVAALALLPFAVSKEEQPKCPGHFHMEGYGQVNLVPTGWQNISVLDSSVAHPHLGGRAYFADDCTAGEFDRSQYVALNLLGKTMTFTTDVSGAGCGCNVAMYLTSMRQNPEVSECGDYYCDANSVCGVMCSEIDIMEANQHAWHSTLHAATDKDGKGAGYGGGSEVYPRWSGPRDWTREEYSPGGKCINTDLPFQVAVSFPTDEAGRLEAMEVTLSQEGSDCPLSITISEYKGMAELSDALKDGMTPIISYWSGTGMLWLDGAGTDRKGPCHVDHKDRCGESIKFYNWKIESISGGKIEEVGARPAPAPAASLPPILAPEALAPAPRMPAAPRPVQQTPSTEAAKVEATAKEAKEVAEAAVEKARVAENLAEAIAKRAEKVAEAEKRAAVVQIRQEEKQRQSPDVEKRRDEQAQREANQIKCFKEGSQYIPLDMKGSERSTEVSAKACQERCSRTMGCAHFTYWHASSGCHLQDVNAVRDDQASNGAVSGPSSCKAEAYCHKYVSQIGCDWTTSHSCPGQIKGKTGLARDDGSRGYQCCCVYNMWEQSEEAAKRALPRKQEDRAPVRLCTASHGAQVGSRLCCGQEGFVTMQSHVCPKERPTCVGLVSHTTWGMCQVAEAWQQCGGKKDGQDWWGPTTCTEGYQCKRWSNDYSQCTEMADVIMMKDEVLPVSKLLNSVWHSPLAPVVVVSAFLMLVAGSIAIRSRRRSRQNPESGDVEGGCETPTSTPTSLRSLLRSRPSATSLLRVERVEV